MVVAFCSISVETSVPIPHCHPATQRCRLKREKKNRTSAVFARAGSRRRKTPDVRPALRKAGMVRVAFAAALLAGVLFLACALPARAVCVTGAPHDCVATSIDSSNAPSAVQPTIPDRMPAPAPVPAPDSKDDLPDAPEPQQSTGSSPANPAPAAHSPKTAQQEPDCAQQPCPLKTKAIDWYKRFMDGPQVKPLTPREKAHLAVRNIIDPFNGLTILAQSSFFVALNSHSAYGPGMPGFARNVGVSYAQDVTSEVFNVFLIPSLTHQDPHYHRMPGASFKRRFLHATQQVVWSLGDNGKGMLNYANLVGSGVDIAIGNLYVPGQQTHLSAAFSEYLLGLATDPIDNYITEFLPDIARRIHIRVVLVQDILNQVSRTAPPAD